MGLPWGRMQGVRPNKPLYNWLDAGLSMQSALAKMQETYGVSAAKLALLRQVAEFEYPILENLPRRAVSIYVGIPFCPSRCLYCSFPSHSLQELGQERQRFVTALVQEIGVLGREVQQLGYTVDSVYVGGGTPTALPARDLGQILQTLRQTLPQPWREFTVEAGRPETLTDEHLAILAEAGVQRISINPQTKQQRTLDLIGRAHSAADIEQAVTRAGNRFSTLNMDLILGLPGEDLADVQASLQWVLGLKPENITLHMFSPKRASRFTGEQASWQAMLPSGDLAASMVETAGELLRQAGYHPYYLYRQRNILGGQENVGWTLPGHACRHNMIMISERQHILGLGGGAASKFINADGTLVTHSNPKDVRVYIDRIEDLIAKKAELLAERSE